MKEDEPMEVNYNLRPLWDALLSIYKEVANICQRHKIRFFVDGGTMLGAVRHNGFIPWDDDFDLRMLQPDVVRFCEAARSELPDNLKIVNWRNTPEYPNLFIKVHETRQSIIEGVEKESGLSLNQGVFIDIFPIIGYPNSIGGRLWWKLRRAVLRARTIYLFRECGETFAGKVAKRIGSLLAPFFPGIHDKATLFEYYEKITTQYPYSESRVGGWFDTALMDLHNYEPTYNWDEIVNVPFDNTVVPIPKTTDMLLRTFYGNYETLPPLGKRHPTHTNQGRVSWWRGPATNIRTSTSCFST